jgi:beta-glucanase (GH16 family)
MSLLFIFRCRFDRLGTIFDGNPFLAAILLPLFIGNAQAKPPPGYTLAWSDDFNHSSVDTNKWTFRVGPSSHSYQQAENISVGEDGLHIAEKAEVHGNFQYTGGGVITQRAWKYGYFETCVKAGGDGWHEAFWSTQVKEHTPNSIEIDALEHDIGGWPSVSQDGISFGVIQRASHKGFDLLRSFPDLDFDLRSGFHTFGYEQQPGFIRFFIDGHLAGICDMRDFADVSSNNIWLSAIATHPDAESGHDAVFQYLRIYQADPETQKQRCQEAYAELDAKRGKTRSGGTDIWMDAASFTSLGGWKKDVQQGESCLLGHAGKNTVQAESDRYASMVVQVPVAGKYQLWVRSYEPVSLPGTRFFNVELGETKVSKALGKGDNPGWNWERGGIYSLPAGSLTVQLYDASAYYPRVGRILMTSDLDFVPNGIGGRTNVKTVP